MTPPSVSPWLLVLVSCVLLWSSGVRAQDDAPECEPACTGMTQCGRITGGDNKCINVIGYGECTTTTDCPGQDGYTLTCYVGECVPTQFFNFECSDTNPCTSPEVCTHFILPGTDGAGWCVEQGSLYAPCAATTECNDYNTELFTVECKEGYCQITDVDSPTPCTTDEDCGTLGCNLETLYCNANTAGCTTDNQCGPLGCDTATGLCRPTPDPDPTGCVSDEQCGELGCDLETGLCRTPTPDPQPTACTSNDQCGDLGCDLEKGLCRTTPDPNPTGCTSDAQCGDLGCDLDTGLCHTPEPNPTACTSDDQCGELGCDVEKGLCRTNDPAACLTDAECGPLGCDSETNKCRVAPDGETTCVSNDDCPQLGCNTVTHYCIKTEGLACTSDNECGARGCDPDTKLCRLYVPVPCTSDDECGGNGCDMDAHFCKPGPNPDGGVDGEGAAAGINVAFTSIAALAMSAWVALRV